MITFLSILAIVCVVFLVVAVPVSIYSLIAKRTPKAFQPARQAIGESALWLAFAVAAVSTLGSLYLSEYANFIPCDLCWFQRIFMYPLPVILGIAAYRKDMTIRLYAIPLAVLGICVSTYHYLIQRFPENVSYQCTTESSCDAVYVWKFHFLSIPGMAWLGFATVIALLLMATPALASASSRDTVDQSD